MTAESTTDMTLADRLLQISSSLAWLVVAVGTYAQYAPSPPVKLTVPGPTLEARRTVRTYGMYGMYGTRTGLAQRTMTSASYTPVGEVLTASDVYVDTPLTGVYGTIEAK